MAKDQLRNETKTMVIGGSAGALVMVLQIIQSLSLDMDLAVLVVLHRKQAEENVLLEVMRSRTEFEVREADDKDEMERGVIYIAPADYHVLIERDGSLTLDDSEKVNFSRPSIDVSFESAAEVYGPSLICVLLSGANADGVGGLAAAKKRGSKIVIQDPETAEFLYMPRTAMSVVKPDLILDENNMADLYDLLQA